MNRMTQKDEQGNWCLKGVAWEQLRVGQTISKEINEKLYGALWKLMKYEDTGLMPEEIVGGQMLTGWIPVEEQLPKDGTYLCTLDGELCGIEEPFTGLCGIENGVWDEPDCVIAWMPLPEPYNAE